MKKMKFAIIGCEHAHISIFIEEMLELGHEGVGIYEPRNQEPALFRRSIISLVDREEQLLQAADIIGSAAINNEKIDIVERCERAASRL